MAEALAFSPDGGLLAIGVGNDTVRLIDLASRTEQRSLTKHSDPYNVHFLIFTRSLTVRGPIAALAFSPDGKTLATGSFNGENVRLWKVADGTFVRSYKNAGPVWALAFSPDGSKLATGGGGQEYSDASLAIWQLR
jgi:WD40 repeat protein